jgi:hypothetical protein
MSRAAVPGHFDGERCALPVARRHAPETTTSPTARYDGALRYCLIYRGNPINLGSTGAVIGRSASCKVLLDGESVSRRHARVTVRGNAVYIEDLDSANGVLINGTRIGARRALQHGDRIEIGAHELRLEILDRKRAAADGGSILDDLWDDEDDADFDDGFQTAYHDALVLLDNSLQAMIERGATDEVEKAVVPRLDAVRAAARQGKEIPPTTVDQALGLALYLARERRDGVWLDYLVDILEATKRPMSRERVDELRDVAGGKGAGGGVAIDVARLRRCVDAMRANTYGLSANDRMILVALDELTGQLEAQGP